VTNPKFSFIVQITPKMRATYSRP